MQIPKPSDDDKRLFHAVVPESSDVEIKPMFGNLGAFVNGNMFAGLFGSTIGVKLLDDGDRLELQALAGTGPFGPSERPMTDYVALPSSWEPDFISRWVAVALDQVGHLPAKEPRGK